MDRIVKPHAVDITRSMQYMDATNGGLLVDFRPIRRYLSIAPGENHYERVRTVLDWIAFAAPLGLIGPKTWQRVFESSEDLARFTAELRRYDVSVDPRHAVTLEQLGVVSVRGVRDHAVLADAIDAARLRKEAA